MLIELNLPWYLAGVTNVVGKRPHGGCTRFSTLDDNWAFETSKSVSIPYTVNPYFIDDNQT